MSRINPLSGKEMIEMEDYLYAYINSATTTQVFTGEGTLVRIINNKCVLGTTIKLIDGTSGSTANIGVITNPLITLLQAQISIQYNIHMSQGLRIITSGNDDLTIAYKQPTTP